MPLLCSNPWMTTIPGLYSGVTLDPVPGVLTMHQVHGAKVVTIKSPDHPREEADALVTQRRDVMIGVRVADCGNLVLCDPVHHVIGICHSGRRSTALNILAETVRTMQNIGTDPAAMVVRGGPSICPSCHQFTQYPDGPFADDDYVATDEQCSPLLDLRRLWTNQLIHAGIPDSHIIIDQTCTMCDDRFPSYKRDGTSERMMCFAGWRE